MMTTFKIVQHNVKENNNTKFKSFLTKILAKRCTEYGFPLSSAFFSFIYDKVLKCI